MITFILHNIFAMRLRMSTTYQRCLNALTGSQVRAIIAFSITVSESNLKPELLLLHLATPANIPFPITRGLVLPVHFG